ncbi:rRNA maturation RNase YbeY [Clostridium felsineum]|uniref:Endoribonuclease YbeY n=1 Tax=Clostridium felsineum TaxID=36839 RepID=A0A1S8LAD5_9CLOT|nr:rRNA maturation RNase YbeY [Clostridium felsineum]URZ01145.1 Endoribonuclease YbeY [Clostridium felsineum]URZ06100.1 Endoribonuclease YbeY [Clostridium felsineum]URZ11137.1 Endoribonuclease YbeY [Clostridium felsineum]URZ15765.1 Endoribonuclease YbeY [Clostridium felsineum DSM 794]
MIYIDNRQKSIKVEESLENTLKEVIDYALKEEGVKIDYEVSVIFVDNETIREINKENRNVDKVTDVLSFPMLDYDEDKVFKDMYTEYEFEDEYFDCGNLVLGDIALSLEKAEEQSTEYGHSFLREATYLTVHSVLHLMGYDHMVEEDKMKMRKREEEILLHFDIKR